MDCHHWKGYTGVQPKDKVMIHIFWDLYFLCDCLSLKGLFYNSVAYQILLKKLLLILTKSGSQWKQRTMY